MIRYRYIIDTIGEGWDKFSLVGLPFFILKTGRMKGHEKINSGRSCDRIL